MKFTQWLETRRELANAYKNALDGVPQDPIHHPEGDALIHTRLVRKAVPKAIQELKLLQQNSNFSQALSEINFDCNEQELNLLYLAAWLHDIGKSTATTIGGQPWRSSTSIGKIQAIGHESPEHYEPQIKKLKDHAPVETFNLYIQNKDLIDFLIQHHMDFTSGNGFSKGFVASNFKNGVVQNSQKMKLLLILMWSDKMGRKPEDTISQAIQKNSMNLQNSIQRSIKNYSHQGTKAFEGTPEQFAQNLNSKPITSVQKRAALKGKFPYLSDEQIAKLTESFRAFCEATQMQPTTIPANIPIDDNIKVLSNVLKQGDPQIEVYVVGGAVRDYLFNQFHGNANTQYKPKDVDLTTNLSEEEILSKLRSPLAAKYGISVKEKESVDTFGVVFATVNRENYEIAPFRKDIGSADGRRPDSVERGTIVDDAMRRDLTINNLYYDFDKGIIFDFNQNGQGIQDIKSQSVRSVGNPSERFSEDKLRVLRLVRFFSRFNSGDIINSLDQQHINAINQFKDLKGVTPERIETEFLGGIKQSLNTAGFLSSLVSLNLMPRVFPGLNVDVQGIPKLGNMKNPKVILAWMLRNNKNIDKSLNALKYPTEISESVQFLINAMNFGAESAFSMIKNRDKRLLKGNALLPNGQTMSQPEIDAHNTQISSSIQNDLKDLSSIVGDKMIYHRLNHLSSYQVPKIDVQQLMQRGLKGPQIGKEQNTIAGNHYKSSFDDYVRKNSEEKM